jgi:hypothetical protein
METPAPGPRGPTSAMVPLPLGEVLRIASEYERAGRFDDAKHLLDHVLAVDPNEPNALHLAGMVAFRRGDPEGALELMQRSLTHGIDTPLYLRNICEIYRVLGRLDEALEAGRRATALAPADPQCLQNQAIIHCHRLELDAALDCANEALRLDPSLPGAHFARAEALLLRGDWAAGFEEYEWRFSIGGASPLMPQTTRPQWDGQPLADETLLLIADQGFGDVVQFCRYIPWAAQRCPRIAVACSTEMAPLVRQLHPGLHLFARWEDCPPYAAFCALSGLPRLHGTRPDNVPAATPYLRVDRQRADRWRARLDRLAPAGYRRVGLVWAGRPKHNNDRNRSASLAAFAPLGALRGIALVSLQKGPATAQAGSYFGRAPLINIGAEIADYDDTMAILDCLDVLVTVDTSVGHLAGAMDRPAWIMLARTPDWRWLLGRADSPWYKSVRLFRQSTPLRWQEPVAEIAACLQRQFELETA